MNPSPVLISVFISLSVHCLAYGINSAESGLLFNNENAVQDTVMSRQQLYNGSVWKNRYHRIEGDQFLFTGLFIPANISMNGIIFKNVRIKYDIFSDEIITPVNNEDILQLNKEMVDSFNITFNNIVYRFINVRNDTIKVLNGYLNLLYKGKSSLYVKYQKLISYSEGEKYDGSFFQISMIYLLKDNHVYQVNGKKSFFRIIYSHKKEISDFMKKNKLRTSKKTPESFVPVIGFYDSLSP